MRTSATRSGSPPAARRGRGSAACSSRREGSRPRRGAATEAARTARRAPEEDSAARRRAREALFYLALCDLKRGGYREAAEKLETFVALRAALGHSPAGVLQARFLALRGGQPESRREELRARRRVVEGSRALLHGVEEPRQRLSAARAVERRRVDVAEARRDLSPSATGSSRFSSISDSATTRRGRTSSPTTSTAGFPTSRRARSSRGAPITGRG